MSQGPWLRWWVWGLAGLMILGLWRLRFNVEVLDLLPSDIPAVEALRNYQRQFANTRELVIALEGSDSEQAERAAASLAEYLGSQPQLDLSVQWQPPWRAEPLVLGEFIAFSWLNQPTQVVAELSARLEAGRLEMDLARLPERLAISLSLADIGAAGYDPLGFTAVPGLEESGLPDFDGGDALFASPDGRFRLVYVQSRVSFGSYRVWARWIEGIVRAVEMWRGRNAEFAEMELGITGQPAFMAEIGRGMERDMVRSVSGTIGIIGLLFLWAHRRLQPLLWLFALLSASVVGTLAVGGLWFGTLNVVSVGFAAILLGLTVDYGLVLYQEARIQPQASARELQQLLAPSIGWAAVTTAAAFLALNLSDLPGLAQLGGLVTVGVLMGAGLMLRFFLGPLLPLADVHGKTFHPFPKTVPEVSAWGQRAGLLGSATLLLGMGWVLSGGWPALDPSARALRPRSSAAYMTLDRIQSRMGGLGEPVWLLVHGTDELEVAARLDHAEAVLDGLGSAIRGATLATGLWARPDRQAANRAQMLALVSRREELAGILGQHGFTGEAVALADRILDTWALAADRPVPFWPTNAASVWLLDRLITRSADGMYALGLIYPDESHADLYRKLHAQLSQAGYQLASWSGLGDAVLDRIRQELVEILGLMGILTMVALSLAFRRFREVLLSLVTLGFTLAALLTIMRWADWSWNLMNLMALPLLLGTSVDYSIHIQLALRRHRGDLRATRRGTGRALMLCGATTVTAFGSLGMSSNAGLASLGQICAVGIAVTVVTAVGLLPIWWRWLESSSEHGAGEPRASRPSRLYLSYTWQLACCIARWLPEAWLERLGRGVAACFPWVRPGRFRVVMANLLPVVDHDAARARVVARRLFRNFGVKLAHLWAHEAGNPVDRHIGQLEGREHMLAALESGRGVLLVSPHLGNWEFGAPLLARINVKLMAVTLEEPSSRLTEMRRRARQRWGTETLVIRRDPFGFLEVLRHLEVGAVVALLIDRPPGATGVLITLFGRELEVSVAPAELARASGCVVLPVYVVHGPGGYRACVLPEVQYERRALRRAEVRREFLQEIMRAFEPVIRQHPDQWYHFVPIWHADAGAPPLKSASVHQGHRRGTLGGLPF